MASNRPSSASRAHRRGRPQPRDPSREPAETPSGARACRGDTARGTCPPPRPDGRFDGACGTSTALVGGRVGTRGRSGSCAGPSERRARARPSGRPRARSLEDDLGSARALLRRVARTSPPGSRAAGVAIVRGEIPSVAHLLLQPERVVAGGLDAHQQAVEGGRRRLRRRRSPTRAPATSVVPEPAKGSSTRPPGGRSARATPRRAGGRTCRGTGAAGARASSVPARGAPPPTTRAGGRRRARDRGRPASKP